MQFAPAFDPNRICQPDSKLFVFDNDKLAVVATAETATVPDVNMPGVDAAWFEQAKFVGSIGTQDCFYVAQKHSATPLPGTFEFIPLRQLAMRMNAQEYSAAFTAKHLLHWDATTRYCGVCGSGMAWSLKERAKNCPACNYVCFPRISPAVIVAVVNNDRILLGRSHHFPGSFYSVIAGFVEPGETLEACVAREVKEETGIDIEEITYFGSQPWPFPDSLMIGFTARYAGGNIQVDGEELAEAAWFTRDNLPEIPPNPNSISRRLIDHFLNRGTV